MSKKTWLTGATSRILTVLGVILLLFATPMYFLWDSIVDYIVRDEMVLRKNSESFKIWRDTPIPMYMNFYLWNWTNPEQLGTVKPILTQLGPYRFYMDEEKTDLVWNENGTITYQIARRWYFDQSRSNGSLDDIVTTLNAVAMSAANTVRHWSIVLRKSVSLSLTTTGQQVFVRQTVGDLLFNGYSDPLLKIAKRLPSFAGIYIPYDKFGWFYLRNSSSDFEGIFNMDTGERGLGDYGKLWRWNHDLETGFYDGVCGRVKGSAGELFPPNQNKMLPLHMFSADLCRTIRLDYAREETISGIKGYRYEGNAWNLDNGTIDPANSCFCEGDCPPVGALNVTTCRFGAPGFVSYPHFLHGSSYYSDKVSGMSPDPDRHSLFITLEPKTGVPLEVAARFQINILLSKVPGIMLYSDVPEIYFPMMWFEQRAGISTELANQLSLVLNLPRIGRICFLVLAIIGTFIAIISVCLSYEPKRSYEKCNNEITLNGRPRKSLILCNDEKEKMDTLIK